MSKTFSNSILGSLSSPPKATEINAWADYIELLCLINVDGLISQADIRDRFSEADDLDEELDEEDVDNDSSDDEFMAGIEDDKLSMRVADWFAFLASRAQSYGKRYPFRMSPDRMVLTRASKMTDQHRMYIFMLLAANLRYLRSKSHLSTITGDFEYLSATAVRRLLPKGARVYIFGSGKHRSTRYSGNLWSKLNVLASDLSAEMRAKKSDFKPTDVGDKGLDIVAWIPFEDELNGKVIFFGQCACTEDWVIKQHSISAAAWSGTIFTVAHSVSMTFIPFSFRDFSHAWLRSSEIQGTILIDRLRLTRLLSRDVSELKSVPAYTLVAGVMAQQETVF